MKKILFFIIVPVLISILCGCSTGVSQQEYDELQRELDRVTAELEKLKEDIIAGDNASGGNGETPASDFEYKFIDGEIEIIKYTGSSVRVRIPGHIEDIPVTSIGEKAFFQAGIIEIFIPESVVNIGKHAFTGNEDLTRVTMENKVVRTGSLIFFGGNFWRILDIVDNNALIISEAVLDNRSYYTNNFNPVITWEECDIRAYLNYIFFEDFFSEAERAKIVETTNINNDNPEYDTNGGEDTADKIFLLSIEEADTYFTDDFSRIAYDKSGEPSYWWLRSPGLDGDRAADIGENGEIRIEGSGVRIQRGILPAMWISLQ